MSTTGSLSDTGIHLCTMSCKGRREAWLGRPFLALSTLAAPSWAPPESQDPTQGLSGLLHGHQSRAPVILHQWGQHFERVCICLCMCELHVKRLEKPFSYLEHHRRAGRTLAIGPRGPDSTLSLTCCVDHFFLRLNMDSNIFPFWLEDSQGLRM